MPVLPQAFWRDANRVPITTDGVTSVDSQVLVGNGAAIVVPIFTITGAIEVRGLWGVVTTDLGSNQTAVLWRINDQTAQVALTLTTTLSSKKAGTVIVKKGLVGAAPSVLDNAAGVVSEPTTLETMYFSPFVIVKKTAALTQIEYLYTTNQTPTTGAIDFYLRWLPLSADAAVTSV